jgi:polyribonucleotide nucleotidyltransferase
MVRAFEFAHAIIKDFCQAQMDFVAEYKAVHALPETEIKVIDTDAEVLAKVHALVTEEEIRALYNLGKLEFHDAIHHLVESVAIKLASEVHLLE